jgi:hypothetical protein
MKQRIFVFILFVALILTMLPTTAQAEGTRTTDGITAVRVQLRRP